MQISILDWFLKDHVTLKSEDWSNDAEKSDLHAALVSIKYCFQKQLKKAYLPQTFNLFIYSILYNIYTYILHIYSKMHEKFIPI